MYCLAYLHLLFPCKHENNLATDRKLVDDPSCYEIVNLCNINRKTERCGVETRYSGKKRVDYGVIHKNTVKTKSLMQPGNNTSNIGVDASGIQMSRCVLLSKKLTQAT